MNYNSRVSYWISIIVLIITGVYTLVYAKLSGFLMVSAVFFLCFAFEDSLELVVVFTVLFAVLHVRVLKPLIQSRLEGFSNAPQIINKIKDLNSNWNKPTDPTGVVSSMTEGFADAPNVSNTSNADDKKDGLPIEVKGAPNSKPVEAVNAKDFKDVPQDTDKDKGKGKGKGNEKNKESYIDTNEHESATNGLFKLGKMPSEEQGGGHLDPGKTLMKSMSSFDPSAISAMTEDTKKLLETQKGLMSMLTQMRPVLADGKELLQTFSGMFGNMKM